MSSIPYTRARSAAAGGRARIPHPAWCDRTWCTAGPSGGVHTTTPTAAVPGVVTAAYVQAPGQTAGALEILTRVRVAPGRAGRVHMTATIRGVVAAVRRAYRLAHSARSGHTGQSPTGGAR